MGQTGVPPRFPEGHGSLESVNIWDQWPHLYEKWVYLKHEKSNGTCQGRLPQTSVSWIDADPDLVAWGSSSKYGERVLAQLVFCLSPRHHTATPYDLGFDNGAHGISRHMRQRAHLGVHVECGPHRDAQYRKIQKHRFVPMEGQNCSMANVKRNQSN